jgi:hypothetical protein
MKLDITKFRPCSDGLEYYNTFPDFETFWKSCSRSDWLLWLSAKLNIDKHLLVLAKGKCAETVIHLMRDERSKNAVQAAISFGNGLTSEDELRTAAAAAYAAYADAVDAAAAADAAAAVDDAHAAYAADAAAAAAAYAAAAAALRTAADAAYDAYADAVDAAAAADAAAADADAHAAYAAYDAAAAAAYAAYADAYDAAADAAAAASDDADARNKNKQKTADICRLILTEAVFTKVKKLQ